MGLFTKFITDHARGAAAGLGRARPVLRGGGPVRRLLGAEAPSLGRRRRGAAGAGGGRPGERASTARPYSSRGGSVLATNGLIHDEMLTTIGEFRRAWSESHRP